MKTTSIRRGMTRMITTAAVLVIGDSASVFACPVCFGAEETAMIDGAQLGTLALLGVTLSVQGAFAGFFLYLVVDVVAGALVLPFAPETKDQPLPE